MKSPGDRTFQLLHTTGRSSVNVQFDHRSRNWDGSLPAHDERLITLAGLDLSHRQLQPELMDQPGLSADLHRQALRGLHRINWLSRSAQILWPEVRQTAISTPDRPCRLIDIASGGGDVSLELARRSAAEGLSVEIIGFDVSATAVEYARENALRQGATNVHFEQRDVFGERLPDGYDVVMCSLFLHHLTYDLAVELLRRMGKAAGRAVLVNDLRRTWLGYTLAWWGARLLTRSPIVHVDGPMSVTAAFTCQEALGLADEAGWHDATCARRWPQRFLLVWRKS